MRTACILGLGLWVAGCAHVYAPRSLESNPAAADFETKARAIVEACARHDFVAASSSFNADMKTVVLPQRLGEEWAGLEERWGPFAGIQVVRGQIYGKGWGAIVVTRFASDVHTFSVYFDPQGLVRALWWNPVGSGAMFVDALGHHQPDWSDALSNGEMHAVAPPSVLEKQWAELEGKFGLYEHISEAKNHGLYVKVIARFGHTHATFRVERQDARGAGDRNRGRRGRRAVARQAERRSAPGVPAGIRPPGRLTAAVEPFATRDCPQAEPQGW